LPLRMSANADPIALVGIGLSVVGSILLDLTNAASGAESFLACLMGVTLSLVLDSTVRAERRFRIRGMIDAVPWFGVVLAPLAAAAADIEHRYGDSPIADEARRRYRHLAGDLDELRHGRITRAGSDYQDLLASTRTCRHTLHAVASVLAHLPENGAGWWTNALGREYWQANLDAMHRGVRIKRLFIYSVMTDELTKVVAEQENAGVVVGLVPANALDSALWHNLAIWDGASAWEARLNATGEIVGNTFTVNETDLTRLHEAFRACERAGHAPGQTPASST
jgi:hypothetical protein